MELRSALQIQVKDQWSALILDMQNDICRALEKLDGGAQFMEDKWEREGGGGGITRTIANGNVFEKGGVNTSIVHGNVTENMRRHLNIRGDQWFACGLSLVLHPLNPFVPTVHCNYRMFELYDSEGKLTDRWFGGGSDLTPYYIIEEDVVLFHRTYKDVCDKFDTSFYPLFKKQCDDYFVNWHRNGERRGAGGIFFDYQRPDKNRDAQFWMDLCMACGSAFLQAYLTIAERRRDKVYTEKNKDWQLIRRGRYVEFNLVHDRGTLFGLKTNGRTESILMSLPPIVKFEYNYQPAVDSEEQKMIDVCLKPRDWVK